MEAAFAVGNSHTILIVDDTADNLMLMNGLLKDQYTTRIATGGRRALVSALIEPLPDLILLDVDMPDIDGYEVCRQLKQQPQTMNIPVIFLTARSQSDDERVGFDAGAVDFITKPFSPPTVLARVKTQLALKLATDRLRDQNVYLDTELRRRTLEVEMIQDVTIMALASLAETRDNETGNHIRRTQHYVRVLAKHLQPLPKFAAALDDKTIDMLFKSAPLHDIGKVGIPDAILLKPGKLTPAEFEIMKQHPALGRNAIVAAENLIDAPSTFLRLAREIAYAHQEKWDGSGYPEQLVGDAIPLSARLMAVADVYDALISKRVYKPAFPHAQAVAIIEEGAGKHFDPDIVAVFLTIQDEFHAIAQRFSDD